MNCIEEELLRKLKESIKNKEYDELFTENEFNYIKSNKLLSWLFSFYLDTFDKLYHHKSNTDNENTESEYTDDGDTDNEYSDNEYSDDENTDDENTDNVITDDEKQKIINSIKQQQLRKNLKEKSLKGGDILNNTNNKQKDNNNEKTPRDIIKCEVCNGQYTRSNKHAHIKTKVHNIYSGINKTLREIVMK